MAEERTVGDLEELEKQLRSLLRRYTSDELRVDGKPFCSDFCELVEEYTSHWQVPLPQLRILEIAICYFAQASTIFTLNCDPVLHTLSSLALSVFELLLFFDQKDLLQEPLKHFTVTFQKCFLPLARHQNVHLLQVEQMVRRGGPWAWPALQAILSGSSLPQSEVDGCISSELPVFFELRVRYLLSCERVGEAMALARCCAWHPTAGQHVFFLQVYLTWLFKTSQRERLHKEVSNFNGKDAVHIIYSMEYEEEDELLLALSRAFLFQQLCRGDMYYLCDLVFLWSKLHHRLKTPKRVLLDDIHQLMLSATNVSSIFPFIRAILQEVGDDGIQLCVELCANALQSRLPCDAVTKALIYKTIAGLLPNDLEVCRACALLVFFLEHSVEAYKLVYLLYRHPDQEFHVDNSPIRNSVRFETLQVLKKDLYFDPEFWNLVALRTNCLKLMSEKVVSSALEEIMEDKWISNYSAREPVRSKVSERQKQSSLQAVAKKRHHKEDRHRNNSYANAKRLKVGQDKPPLGVNHAAKRKGNQRALKDAPCQPLRRSFWQLDRLQGNGLRGERRTTRLSERNPSKRRIKKPKWLLEDSGTLEENNAPLKTKKHRLRNRKYYHSSVGKRTGSGRIKNKPSRDSLTDGENRKHKGFSLACQPAAPPQVILELSLPDNELLGSFIEETCNRQRGFPQVLLYKPTVKLPAALLPLKPVHGKEVVLRARDEVMFVQQLHCYCRRKKGKGNGSPLPSGSVSTITRSSVQGSPPKVQQREQDGNPAPCVGAGLTCLTPAAGDPTNSPVQTENARSRKTSTVGELPETTAVETTCPVAAPDPAGLDHVPPVQTQKMELLAESAAELNGADALQVPVATEATEPPAVLQAKARQHCEDSSAVEMKVTIASQTQTAGKVTRPPGPDVICDPPTRGAASEITTPGDASKTSPADNHTAAAESHKADPSNRGAAGPVLSQFQDIILRDGRSLSSQSKPGSPDVFSNSISGVDISCKLSEEQALLPSGTSPGTTTISTVVPSDPDAVGGTSDLTLATGTVPGLASEEQVFRQPVPEDDGHEEPKDRTKPEVPGKFQATSRCPVTDSTVNDEQREGTEDLASETSENIDQVESEESKLEYCCTFCNKDFKGSRVVAHAMFHYRKDECMFCGTTFKDDLLAMMHLSDHIEKLKRSKESAGNKAQESWVSETKDISTPKPSAKAKTANVCSGPRSSGRQRKSACSKSISLPRPTQSVSRNLRSSVGASSQRNKQNSLKQLERKTHVHAKINGHVGRKKMLDRRKADGVGSESVAENPRRQGHQDVEMDSTTSIQIENEFTSADQKMETEFLQVLKTAAEQEGELEEQKSSKSQETVCCPVDGCSFSTDASKNRVALLYHALEDHFGDVEPLQLAFRIGNNRCSICMRVLWSFEHFQHHVERHRLIPRHPCLHRGCTARFKTGIEMRRHTRRHSPLQAACCLPGCPQLFICLWALNLHEREHYASKSPKPDKSTNRRASSQQMNSPAEGTLLKDEPGDETAAATEKSNVKDPHESRGDARPAVEHENSLSSAAGKACLLKRSGEIKESHVLKNLSNKDTSIQTSGPAMRLRQTPRKTNPNLAVLKGPLKSLLKLKARPMLKKKAVDAHTQCPKRRGRPPKLKFVPDENTATSQRITAGRSVELLASSSEAAEISQVGRELKDEEKNRQLQGAETSTGEATAKKPIKKRSKESHAKQKGVRKHTKPTRDRAQKSTPVKMKSLHRARKHLSPEGNGCQTSPLESSEQKQLKVTDETGEEPEFSLGKHSESKPLVPQVDAEAAAPALDKSADQDGKANPENADPTQTFSGGSVLAVLPVGVNETSPPLPTSGEEARKVSGEEPSKESQDAQEKGKKGKKSAESSTRTIKHKDTSKIGDKTTVKERRPSKGATKASKLKTVELRCVDQQLEMNETAAAEEESVKEASAEPKPTGPPKRPAPPEAGCEGEAKTVKKKAKGPSDKKPKKSNNVVERPVGEEREASKTNPRSTTPRQACCNKMNGQAEAEDTSTVCKLTLAEYGKKPHLRAPPTAYLHERYITMPKRRTLDAGCQSSQRPRQEEVSPALKRQRCGNCFATFASVDRLQSHLQLMKCSSLFGFDSDDEGSGSACPFQTK